MIKRVIAYSIDNPLVVALAFVLVAAWGLWAVAHTPVDAIPDVSDNQVIVYADWPGRGPMLVEDQVTFPLSSALQGVPGLRDVRGQSSFGTSLIYAIFDDDVDQDTARARVLEKLSGVTTQLPAGVTPTLGPDGTGVGHVLWYTLENDGSAAPRDLGELRALQDWTVRLQLASVDGVAEVASIGGFVRELHVDLDPELLRAEGLTADRVASAVRSANRDAGGQLLELADAEVVVRALGSIEDVDDIERTAVGRRADGSAILVRDVAHVQLGAAPRRGMLDKNGNGEVVGGIVVMRQGANARQVIEGVKERLIEVQRGLPQGVAVRLDYDRSELIDAAVDTLQNALLEEVVIVCLVVLVFLFHVRAAVVVVVTLPMAVLMSFIAMGWLNVSSNIMSLGGIAIAIGVLVDAAIVMVENGHRQLQEAGPGADRLAVIKRAAAQVGPALFLSLVLIIASFAPVYLLTGQEGRLYAPLAWTKTLAMAGAALISVTLVPVLMRWLLRSPSRPEASRVTRALTAVYRPALAWALRNPWKVLALNGVALLLVLPLSVNILAALFGLPAVSQLRLDAWGDERPDLVLDPIGNEVLVTPDEGDLLYMPTTLPGVSASEAKRLLQVTDAILAAHPQVAAVLGKAGRAETSTDPAPLSMLETTIRLTPRDTWPEGKTVDQVLAELDAATRIPGLTNGWTQPIINRIQMQATGIRTDVGIKLIGPDEAVLGALAEQAEQLLSDIRGVEDLYAERVSGGHYLDISIDRDAAARAGVSVEDIDRTVELAIGGMPLTWTTRGRERIAVRVRLPLTERDSPAALQTVPVAASVGPPVALGRVADIELVDGPAMVRSENGQLLATTVFNVRGRDLDAVLADVEHALAALEPPAGTTYRIAGQYESLQRLQSQLRLILPVALLVIFGLLYLTFRDVTEALLVMLSVPFALVGGVVLLWAVGQDFSVAVWVGFIALFGVAVETGVVMVLYLREALEARGANGPLDEAALHEATMAGSVLRLRPKLMTVSTTLLGLTPLLWASGVGADVMAPIAIPMVGGMVTSAVHVLWVTPVIFLLMQRARLRRAAVGATPASSG